MRLSITQTAAFLFLVQFSLAQTIPVDRVVDWSGAGLSESVSEPETGINFLDVGGISDGQTPNDEVWQSILSSTEEPLRVFFPAGDYLFNEEMQLQSNMQVSGQSADSTKLLFDLGGSGHLITAIGANSNVQSLLNEDASRFASYVILEASDQFSPGDFVKIIDDDEDKVTSSWAVGSTGQIIEIDFISEDSLFLKSELRRDFSLTNNAEVRKLDLRKNIVVKNLSVERLDETEAQSSNLFFNYTQNCSISCIKSLNCNFAHVDLRNSSHVSVEGSWFQDAFGYGSGGKAYGVVLQYSTGDCLISDNVFVHLRHSMLLQAGANGNVLSYNYSREPFWTDVFLPADSAGDLVLHGNYPYANLFESNIVQNIVIDDSHGINGPYNTLFRNRAEYYGVFMNSAPPSDQQNFVANEITNSSFLLGLYLLSGADHFEYGNNLQGAVDPLETEISENSLYLEEAIPYYLGNNSWPPIGSPNMINEHVVAAQNRYNDGIITACFEGPLSPIVTLEDAVNLKIIPNPATDYVSIQSEKPIIGLSLFSLDGRMILKNHYNSSINSIDISHLLAGVYVLEIELGTNEKLMRKLVVQ